MTGDADVHSDRVDDLNADCLVEDKAKMFAMNKIHVLGCSKPRTLTIKCMDSNT